MFRYKLTIEYDGTAFCGWQRQSNGLSVQEVLEKAVYNFTKEEVGFVAAGRTDAGVHALGQVAHFDIARELEIPTVIGAINYHVKPYKVVVIDAELAELPFHARFSCKSRSYKYQILNRPAPTAIFNGCMWHIKYPLNIVEMNEAAHLLLGKQDLSSFRSVKCQALSPIKTIDALTVKQISDNVIEIFISAPSFMHNQVRIITGCLVKVGLGDWNKDDFQRVIKAKDRTLAANTAPAHGLYFYQAKY